MNSALFLMIVVVSVTFTACECVERKFVSLAENRNSISRNWNCSRPKPKLVYVEALMADLGVHKHGVVYEPPAIVVHTCGSEFGCCRGYNTQCQANKQETVTYEVLVRPLAKQKAYRTEIDHVNHTSCHCATTSTNAI